MNAKKDRRRASKLMLKLDRGSQHRKMVEGKSNIAAKRVTLLPGFLINGFTSTTAKKTKGIEDSQNNKNHLLNEDLQAFLEQKRTHPSPRRSQRILKKHLDQHCNTSPKNLDSIYCDNFPPQTTNDIPNNVSFKSILKNSSKSVFKEIRAKFAKVNIVNTKAVAQKAVSIQENQNVNQNITHLEASSDQLNQNINYFSQCPIHLNQILQPEERHVFKIDLNRSFCKDLEKQICVAFKRQAINECRQNIGREVETTNMVLQGRIDMREIIVRNSEDNDPNVEVDEGPRLKFYPIPAQNWIYSTPRNQKIGVLKLKERHLQTGVLCHDKNQQNLYEVKPNIHVNFSTWNGTESVPIDDRFLKRVAQARRTPANFEFRRCKEDNGAQNVIRQSWSGDPVGCGGSGVETGGQKETFVNPFHLVDVISPSAKTPRNAVFSNYLQDNMPTPKFQEYGSEMFGSARSNIQQQDYTFIEEGNDFKMRESQPIRGNKRRLSEEEFAMKRKSIFKTESSKGDDDKMFNFTSPDKNMFIFGKM